MNQKMQYGTLKKGGVRVSYATNFPSYYREDIYVSNDGGEYYEPTLCLHGSDLSDRHNNQGGYDAKCSCCYLGIAHTVDRHNNALTSRK